VQQDSEFIRDNRELIPRFELEQGISLKIYPLAAMKHSTPSP
jgi:hypothetical protein